MNKETSIRLFEDKKIRSVWDDENEKWYFSIVDVFEMDTGQLFRLIQSIPSPKAEPFNYSFSIN